MIDISLLFRLDVKKPVMATHLVNITILPPSWGKRRILNMRRMEFGDVLRMSTQMGFYLIRRNLFILEPITYIIYLEHTIIQLLLRKTKRIFLISLNSITLVYPYTVVIHKLRFQNKRKLGLGEETICDSRKPIFRRDPRLFLQDHGFYKWIWLSIGLPFGNKFENQDGSFDPMR